MVEDAAQGFMASYRGRPLGTLGTLGALSFHQTKNVVSGEGGLLIVNDPALVMRANIVREKGTNRTEFLRGVIDKYEWLDVGSSYLPSDLVAAVLFAQLEGAVAITNRRQHLWNLYHEALLPLEREGLIRRPIVPVGAQHNAHIYRVLFDTSHRRDRVSECLRVAGIGAATHYVPLHSAPAGRRYGRVVGSMEVTDRVTATMLRLPIHGGLRESDIDRIVSLVSHAAREQVSSSRY
jgi:dTDP-4-amino-4,6-dideoxygalactose transaminase